MHEQQFKYMVHVWCETFNHAPYIINAMDGFTMQDTTFPYVCTILDDNSTDGEQDVISNYLQEHFDLDNSSITRKEETDDYRLTFARHKTNLNCYFAVLYLKYNHRVVKKKKDPYVSEWHNDSKYTASCEGDDYWTDSHKLQIQFEFMEKNPQYLFCCHRYKIFEPKTKRFLKEYTYDYYVDNNDLIIDESLYLKVWVTQTLTVFLKTDFYDKTLNVILNKYSSSRDVYFFYTLLQIGKGISLNREMGVYRWHEGGISIGQKPYQRYKTGFNIYTEILEQNPHDKLLVPKVIYNGIRLLRYSKLNGEALSIFNNLWKLSNNIKEKMNLAASLIVPSSIFVQLAKLYSKRRLERLTISS